MLWIIHLSIWTIINNLANHWMWIIHLSRGPVDVDYPSFHMNHKKKIANHWMRVNPPVQRVGRWMRVNPTVHKNFSQSLNAGKPVCPEGRSMDADYPSLHMVFHGSMKPWVDFEPITGWITIQRVFMKRPLWAGCDLTLFRELLLLIAYVLQNQRKPIDLFEI